MCADQITVQTAEGGGGLKRFRLLRRSHGLFLYEEVTLQDEIYHVEADGTEGPVVAEAYWMPTHVSGLFDSEMSARDDALATLPWLRAAIPNVR
jgi:hypothetical protein